MKPRHRSALILVISLALFVSCRNEAKENQTKTASFDEKAVSEALKREVPSMRGAWTSDTSYENHFFQLKVSIPTDWYLTKGQDEKRNQAAAEFLSGSDSNLKGALETAIKKTFTAFWAYRYPPGTPGKTNPNMSMVIEPIDQLPGIKSEADYLQAIESTLKMTNRNFVFKNPATQAKLGGLELWSREAETSMGNLKIKQRYYARLKDRMVLLIGLTFLSDEDEGELKKITDTLQPLS